MCSIRMPLKRRIPALGVLAKDKVSELLVMMLCSEDGYTDREVSGVCSILTSLGQLHTMVETVLDKLCEVESSPSVWARALSCLITSKTRSLKIKPGWNCGDSLQNNLTQLTRLVYLDITGKNTKGSVQVSYKHIFLNSAHIGSKS